MYDMKGFGARIADLRKSKNMTQEELAERLGLTSQAVSKWENNLSYPDITLIPTLCTIFDISLDDIFGKIKKDTSNLAFPSTFKGLGVVAAFANMACYSDKEPAETGGSTVTFKDGSIAELQSRRVVNKGVGRIILKCIDDFADAVDIKTKNKIKEKNEMTSISHAYGDIMELSCEIPNANCEIIKVDKDVTKVFAEGYTELIDLLQFDYDGVVLKIDFDKDKMNKIDTNKWDIEKNKIKINLASKLDRLHKINLILHGSGSIDLKVPAEGFGATIHGSGDILAEGIDFAGVNATIHGSGDIKFGGADAVNATIHGSGDIKFGDAKGVNVAIHGSGDIEFGNVYGVNAEVHGSGDIKFGDTKGGNISIHGSGDVKFNEAVGINAEIHGSGDIGLHKCADLKININGSGELNADEVTKSIDISIRGSGEINIKKGEVETFNVYLDNGEVNAKGVTTDRAKIEMPNTGKVEIGRVKIESVEICGDNAEVIIHQRG